MKFKITLKDTDTLIEAIKEAVEEKIVAKELSEEALEVAREKTKEELLELAGKWFEYSEYLTVEIDTGYETIRVVPLEEQEN